MISSWFNSPERIAALEFKAGKWVGTPFFANSNTPGPRGGVSCQKLVAAIYRECGCCDIEVPEVAMSHAKFSRVSLMEEFMAGRKEFVDLLTESDKPGGMSDGSSWKLELLPGDLIGLRIGHIIHQRVVGWDVVLETGGGVEAGSEVRSGK
jgi:cell wall-associated NlpC family hydrolase